jgi:hypothetical protein
MDGARRRMSNRASEKIFGSPLPERSNIKRPSKRRK